MTVPTGVLCGTSRTRIDLGQAVGPPGAEGTVFRVSGRGDHVAKIYHVDRLQDRDVLESKVGAMIAKRPSGIPDPEGHWPLAWPLESLFDASGGFVGFTMPAVETGRATKWHVLANPSDRDDPPASRAWTSGFNWSYRLTAAANLAHAVESLLSAGYVPGDLAADNVFVDSRSLVTVIDIDSMQVPGPGGQIYHCRVWRDEYLAPELAPRRDTLDRTDRGPESALFALAVLIYEMLMEGRHPYTGRWHGADEPPSRLSLSHTGTFVDGPDSRLTRGVGALKPTVLPPQLRNLFMRAFVDGATRPDRRPTCAEWRVALDGAAGALSTCDRGHPYPVHHSGCPWCRRVKTPRPEQKPPRLPSSEPVSVPPTPPPVIPLPRPPPPPLPPPLPSLSRGLTVILMAVAAVVGVVLLLNREDAPKVGLFHETVASNAPPGTCIATREAWEGDKAAVATVGCDEEHWGEVLGYPGLGAVPSPYPGADQVSSLALFECGRLVAERGLDTDRYWAHSTFADGPSWYEGGGRYENYATCIVAQRDDALLPAGQLVRPDQPLQADVAVQMGLFNWVLGANAPVGSCVATKNSVETSVHDVPVVRCEQSHWAEVLGYPVLYEPGSPWPGDQVVYAAAAAACGALASDRELPAQYTYRVDWPGQGWWAHPELRIYASCLAHRTDDQVFTSPLQ